LEIIIDKVIEETTNKQNTELKIQESVANYKSLYNNMNLGFALHEIITDSDGKPYDYIFLDINEKFEEFTGLKAEGLVGKRFRDINKMSDPSMLELYGNVAFNNETIEYEEFNQQQDKYFNIRVYSPSKAKFVVLLSDVTTERKMSEELQLLSMVDSLTGLGNRRYFEEMIEHELSRSYVTMESMSILMIDIDDFKEYNNIFGRILGDACLTIAANQIRNACFRITDFVCKYDEDTFVAVLPDTDSDGAVLVAKRIIANLAEEKIVKNKEENSKYLTLSIGNATTVPRKVITKVELVNQAKAALEKAKQGGKNKYIIYKS
jgi:diguanylate cyclase (GGDEF)-like protein/PAS domain S-box-containing protein